MKRVDADVFGATPTNAGVFFSSSPDQCLVSFIQFCALCTASVDNIVPPTFDKDRNVFLIKMYPRRDCNLLAAPHACHRMQSGDRVAGDTSLPASGNRTDLRVGWVALDPTTHPMHSG